MKIVFALALVSIFWADAHGQTAHSPAEQWSQYSERDKSAVLLGVRAGIGAAAQFVAIEGRVIKEIAQADTSKYLTGSAMADVYELVSDRLFVLTKSDALDLIQPMVDKLYRDSSLQCVHIGMVYLVAHAWITKGEEAGKSEIRVANALFPCKK
jgi:hypothetical protein